MPRKSASNRSATKSNPSKGTAVRLQRLLASAGFGSRRQCEELIEEGRIHVDGKVVTKLGTSVDPEVSKVVVDGVPLKKQKLVYYAVNKPVGVVTTNRDPHGRPRVVDLVPKQERVFPVGRLDRSSEGLILLTNDGELAQKLSHPKFGVKKIYRVTVAGKVETETMKQMRKGIYIAEGFVRVDGARLLKSRSRATELEIILREGKNREIRRILARLGHKVLHLRRIAVGPLRLGDIPPGAYRVVSREEVKKLRLASEASKQDAPKKRQATKKQTGKRPAKQQSKRQSVAAVPPKKKKTAQRRTRRSELPNVEISQSGSQTSGSIIGGDSESQSETPRRKPETRASSGQSKAGKRVPRKRRAKASAKTGNPKGVHSSSRGTGHKKPKPSTRKPSAKKRKR